MEETIGYISAQLNLPNTSKFISAVQSVSLTLLKTLLVFVIGMILIRYLLKIVGKIMKIRNVDGVLCSFVNSLLKAVLYVLLVMCCATVIGLNITPFITAIGAVGLAVSLSIKDALANLAGGVFILITKPFKSGDYVALKGTEGTIEEINLLHTVLNTADKKRVYVPNGDISTATIINYSAEPQRRMDIAFMVEHGTDVNKVRAVVLEALKNDPKICKEPKSEIFVSGYTENAVNMLCRVWVNNGDYWDVYFGLHESLRDTLDKNGFATPAVRISVVDAASGK